jgi:hypothetical protein
MQPLKFATAILAVWLFGGCAATPPSSRQVSHDPILGRQSGVLLLVDACVQRTTLATSTDYFVINEAEAGAQATLRVLRKYVQDSGIPVRAEVVSICGARLSTNNAPIRVAESVGGSVQNVQPPAWITGTLTNDAPFVHALGVVSTYAFERAAVNHGSTKTGGKRPKDGELPASITINEFQSAAEVIRDRTQASSVLFLGVLGTSRSEGKATAQFLAGLAVGVGTAVATAGLGTGFYLVFVPGHQADGMVMEGALIDLETGQLTWSNAVRAGGDPIHPKAMANSDVLSLLFRDIMFKPVANPPASLKQ